MPLSFPNVSLLGLTQESRFFGAGFQYATFRRAGIEGMVTDLTALWGITGVWSGQQGLIKTVANQRDYQDLYLNGVSFGSGRVESISFDAGVDVRTKRYTANILIYDSGNMFNFTGLYYSGVDMANSSQLDSFNESYVFNRKQNGGYGYSHNASIKFISGAGALNAIDAAKALARTLFTGSNLGMAFYSGYTNKQGKRYGNETYSLIDNTCTFQETFDFDADLGAYSVQRTNSFDLQENGVINVTENGALRGIENPNYQRALSAVATETTGSYYRCSGMQAYYYPSGLTLQTYPIINGRTLDIFNNNVGYTLIYTNNPNNSGTYLWDYTQQISRADNVGTITEDGSIVGRGTDRTTAFTNAQGGFVVVRNGIPGRMASLFLSNFASSTGYLENKSESYSPYQGQVTYGYQYSNDPNLVSNSGVRRIETTEENASSIYAYNRLNIFNYASIVQDDHQSTVGADTLRVNMQGDKTVGLATFLASGLNEINSRIPAGNNLYIDSCTYSYQPNANTVDLSLTWLYNMPAVKTINV